MSVEIREKGTKDSSEATESSVIWKGKLNIDHKKGSKKWFPF